MVQSYTSRFKQTLSELEYPIQDEHSNPTTRNIILEQENKEAVKFYVHNFHREIAQYIIPMKPKTLIRVQQEAMEIEIWTKESKPHVTCPTLQAEQIKSLKSLRDNQSTPHNNRSPLSRDHYLNQRYANTAGSRDTRRIAVSNYEIFTPSLKESYRLIARTT